MPDYNNGRGSSANWTVNKRDLADSVLTDQKFGTDRFAVAKQPRSPAVVLEQQHQSDQNQIRTRDSDEWGSSATGRSPPKAPCPPEAVAAMNDGGEDTSFLRRCARKARGIVYDLQHFKDVRTPDGDNSFVGKMRYIATRDDRCGVSVGLVVLVSVVLLSIVALVVAMGINSSPSDELNKMINQGPSYMRPRLPSTAVNYFNAGSV